MTPEERDRLDRFLAQLAAVRGIPKDPEAEARIRDALARQPDATYLLVTRALLLEQALEEANGRLAAAEWQRAPGQGAAAAPRAANEQAATGTERWGRAQPAAPAAAPAAAPGAGGSSFLRNAAAAAAGVAGGAFLFQGLQHLLGNWGGGGWGGGNTLVIDERNPLPDTRVEDLRGPDDLTADSGFDTADPNVDPLADTDVADNDLDGAFGGDDGSFDV